MAYVATRRNGRFEIRESLHTPRGPRAHSLAGFAVLTGDVLASAARRAQRPFDPAAVLASARRAGAPITEAAATAVEVNLNLNLDPQPATTKTAAVTDANRRFVEASRRMARSMRRKPAPGHGGTPGNALIELLGFADAVTASQPPRRRQPLAFPVLAHLLADRTAAGHASPS